MINFEQEIASLKHDVNFQLYLHSSWGLEYEINIDQMWATASLIKLGIAAYGQQLFLKQPHLLEQQVTLQPEDIVPGGTLSLVSPRVYTVKDLLQLMLIQSDNTATNALLTTWGMKTINDWLKANYSNVLLQRRLMAPPTNGENLANAKSLGQLLAAAFKYDDEYAQAAQASMHAQMFYDRLVWPVAMGEYSQIKSYNKTGDLLNYAHDAARLELGNSWIECVVMTKFSPNEKTHAVQFMQNVGRLLCQMLTEQNPI
ncbi:class A beta-lactamase-related serine hydrolase [Lactobacillus sp. ESL0731]|uniref:serine hydrolase n=1 Tax=unclassified Lactobacillus TaxID=2620435 RepID=UPI0023F9D163|nr:MULTISPECIES: serine hydrolase [unclassified Lactobacillus]WEV50869.1 class A beta-lactamase-related serine hydrolase [Lactobacillus sp. ESL0700]WEV62000.1 class A beta-lactamase-related serine hydrolase [Lactobacillus sp. ESL0731]